MDESGEFLGFVIFDHLIDRVDEDELLFTAFLQGAAQLDREIG